MSHRGCNGLTPSRTVLESAERADPRGHAIHVGIALLWAAMQSITIAGEGISWGMLAVITVLRLPRIHWAYRPAWRDPLWWVLVAWFGWSSLTFLWGPEARPAVASGIPDRWLITPLLLWPIMLRPWMLLGAFAAGGTVHACVAILLSWTGSGWGAYDDFRALSNLSSAQWQFPVTMVICALGVRWAGQPLRVLPGVGFVAAAWCVWLVAMRNAMLAAVVGAIMVFVRPVPRRRWHPGAALAMLLGAGAIVGWGISESPAWERSEASVARAAAMEGQGLSTAALEQVSSGRFVLILAAWDIGRRHPILGGGAGWFASQLPVWAMDRVARSPAKHVELSKLIEGGASHVHSTLVHEWVDGGIPSVALLGSVLLGLAWRLWRQARASPIAGAALALYSLVLLYVPFGIITLKAPGALIAVCLAISWLGLGYRVAKPIT